MRRSRALSLLAAAAASAPRAVRAQTTTLRIGASITDLYLAPYIALDAGFFSKAGLNVEVTAMANGGAIAAAVAGGALDAGLADMIQIANAANRGLPFAFFAGSGLYSSAQPILGMCVAGSSPYKTGKDLEGQTIAMVALKSITEAAIREWLRKSGADIAKVKFFELPYTEMGPALARGAVAAAFIGEPFLSAAKNDVRVIGNSYDSVAPSFYISAFFASRDWMAKNPDVARKLAQAIQDSARWANGHRADTALILAKYSKLDLDRIKAMNRTTYATTLDPKLMQPVLDIAAKYSLIEKPVAATDLIVRLPGIA